MRLAHKVATSAAVVGALLLLGTPIASSDTSGTTGPTETYLVLYEQQAVPADAATQIAKAGGSVVHAYDAIGVVVARSNNSAFSSRVAADSRVEGASATTNFASKLDAGAAEAATTGDLPNAPATDADTFSGMQWDMRQIHTPQAHAITGGSPAVVVGDIDTGLDYTHPDLAANVSSADSANCVSGSPVPGAVAANDDNGHGTHTAGTIAAASNGIGIVGVAPNVKVAGIKAGNAAGFFFPEAVVCAFMWAGDRQLDVTNNSYFADPWEYNCRNDAGQRAIWKAEQRAIRYAQNQGVTVVASAGNDSDDVSHPTTDKTSPDDTTPVTRDITNACVVIPLEISGVVGVSATGSTTQGTSAGEYADNLKSYYSSYGVSVVDVTAPGGDRRFFTPESVNGRVLSTWPATTPCAVPGPVDPGVPSAKYCWAQGTSMAGPHVAGVAALIVSRYGTASSAQNGTMAPGQVASMLGSTADPQACPTTLPTTPSNYLSIRGVNSGAVQHCEGGPGHNSWYGNGQVDALNAVGG
jgi:lantibiotic leader peptide-processing serine protease